MLDFEIQRCTRRCAESDRELRPGEMFYSTLVSQGATVVRHDYSMEAWHGPPEGAMCWWKSQMPDPTVRRLHWAPNDVILHYFVQMAEQPDQQDVRYVLALLMIRRRIVRLERTESDTDGGEVLVLSCARNEDEYQVRVVYPSGQRVAEIQEQLGRLLFGQAA